MRFLNTTGWYLALLALLSAWVCFFSPPLYPLLDADQAIHVLMVADLKLPDDWYYWGQDRLGSFMPLLARPFFLLGLEAVWAYTVAQLLAFLSWAWFLNRLCGNRWLALAALALLIFPPLPFSSFILPGHPFLAQITFTLAGIHIAMKPGTPATWLGFPPIAALAVWSSELSLPFFGVLGLMMLRETYHTNGPRALVRAMLLLIPGTAAGLWFLLYTKQTAHRVAAYSEIFGTREEIIRNLEQFGVRYGEILFFGTGEWGTSVSALAWTMLLLAGLVLMAGKLAATSVVQRALLISGALVILLLPFSHWVAMMGSDPRYYGYGWLLLTFSILPSLKGLMKPVAGLLMVFSAAFGWWSVEQVYLTKDSSAYFKPGRTDILSLAEKVRAPAIASYWTAYVYTALHPDHPRAIPSEGEYLRNGRQINSVLSSDTVAVIGSFWLETYPDTLKQYNRELLLIHPPETAGDLHFALYRPLKTGE